MPTEFAILHCDKFLSSFPIFLLIPALQGLVRRTKGFLIGALSDAKDVECQRKIGASLPSGIKN